MMLLLAQLALGEQRVPLSSQALDAVLVLPDSSEQAHLLVANASTSAPVSLSSATLNLSGPVDLTATFSGTEGVHEGRLALSQPGDYAGSLVVEAAGQTDLFAVGGLTIAPPVVPTVATPSRWPFLLLPLLFAIGFFVGRWRQAAGAALLVLAGLSTSRVLAHGGEDHGAPASTTPLSSSLTLKMESQFLIGLRTLPVYAEAFAPHTLGLGSLSAAPGGAATLRASVNGTLQAVGPFPTPGAQVMAGQVLALLRETPSSVDRAALLGQQADAESRLAAAKAALRLAQRDAEQVDQLGAALSERERVERQNAVEVATVGVREAERAAAGSGLQVPVTAPLSGRIALGEARPGDVVEAGDELFHVLSDEALWLRASVPESQAVSITVGGPAEVTLPSLPGKVFPAVILDGGLESNPQTGTVTVTLALAPNPALRPGLAATAWIASGPTEDVLTVPDDAVVESNGSTLVFIKTGPEHFEVREVSLGERNGSRWEVHRGLKAAERVVVSGTYALKSLAGR